MGYGPTKAEFQDLLRLRGLRADLTLRPSRER